MRILLAVFALLLAGCGSGPDEAALKEDVAARLAQALPEGTLSFADFARRGSQSDTKAPSGETRRIVYFDAELKLERDFDFGAWDAPGVAGLVSAFGTAPKGIIGIQSGGNKAGDLLSVHGTALYKREDDGWRPVVAGGYTPVTAPAYATSAPGSEFAEILESMHKIAGKLSGSPDPVTRRIVMRELEQARASIQAAVARAEAGYAIAAGPEHGQYLRFAQALPDPTTVTSVALVTRGGDENLRMLREGKVQIALAQADAALDAYEGRGSFAAAGPHTTLRAVGSLYPEAVHIIVRADSPFATPADLAGRRVNVGPPGAASRTTALRVLAAHGLKNVKLAEYGLGDALVELRNGKVDAVIQVIGVPANRVRDALAAVPLRLLPMSKAAIAKLAGAEQAYFTHTIPRGAYAVQTEDVPTIATAALLLVDDVSEAEVAALTHYVFGPGRDFAARGSAQGAQVSATNARLGLSLPLHIGAARTLQELAPAKGE